MNAQAINWPDQHDYVAADPAALAECVAPLGIAAQRALREYWDQVVREEWIPPARRVPSPLPPADVCRRERREARRAMARIAAASRSGQVVVLYAASSDVEKEAA